MSELTIREEYLKLIALCGELPVLRAPRLSPAHENSVARELRRMEEDELIRRYTAKDGRRVMRLAWPEGANAVSPLSPALLSHIEAVIGEKKDRYAGSKKTRAKKACDAVATSLLTQSVDYYDGIDLRGALPYSWSLEDFIPKGGIGERETLFISAPILNKAFGEHTQGRITKTSAAGILIAPSGPYMVFSTSKGYITVVPSMEASTKQYAKEFYASTYNSDDTDMRQKAIIMTATTSTAEKFYERIQDEELFSPTKIFSLSYIVPADKNAADIVSMISQRGWHEKTNEALKLKPTGEADGRTPDGKPIYNLLCSNLGRTQEVEGYLRSGRATFILHDWQKEILEKAYETKLDGMVLNDMQFKGLLRLVRNM